MLRYVNQGYTKARLHEEMVQTILDDFITEQGQSPDKLHFAAPTVEIDRTRVIVKTKRYRKTRVVPTEYPEVPQDPNLYTGERSMYAKTKEGGDMAEFDNWIEKGSVVEPYPWVGTTVF